MTPVPQRTLEWLWRVLTSNSHDPRQAYVDPQRTYSDVAHLLSQYRHFAPRTDVYTYETGTPTLLLQLYGTLPVPFRGTTYHYPLTIWLPLTYPRDAPLVYISPTADMNMRVRPGQHVAGDGRVYHWYLTRWMGGDTGQRSSVVELLGVLRDVFGREPPVVSVSVQPQEPQQQQGQQQHGQQIGAPPVVPPLPPELRAQRAPATPSPVQAPVAQQQQQQGDVPPPVPPKPGERPGQDYRPRGAPEDRYSKPPPLPPVPGEFRSPRQSVYLEPQRGFVPQQTPSHQRQFSADVRGPVSPLPHSRNPSLTAPFAGYSGDVRSPVSPLAQPIRGQFVRQPQAQPGPSQVQPTHGYGPPQGHPPPQQLRPSYGSPQHPPPAPHQAPPKKTDTPDLLTSPFDLALPEPTSGPPPPIPPNPEKDALLHSLSRALTQTLQSNVDKTNSAIPALHSQSKALHAAMSKLQSEISSLNTLHSTLQSNISTLQHSLHQADTVIADAKTRLAPSEQASSSTEQKQPQPTGLPPIDDVLVAPTVVGKQLYDLVAEERGIQRALYALQVGLVRGRVGVDSWAKHTRGLAREAFLKKALIKKAGRGMGLSSEVF